MSRGSERELDPDVPGRHITNDQPIERCVRHYEHLDPWYRCASNLDASTAMTTQADPGNLKRLSQFPTLARTQMTN